MRAKITYHGTYTRQTSHSTEFPQGSGSPCARTPTHHIHILYTVRALHKCLPNRCSPHVRILAVESGGQHAIISIRGPTTCATCFQDASACADIAHKELPSQMSRGWFKLCIIHRAHQACEDIRPIKLAVHMPMHWQLFDRARLSFSSLSRTRAGLGFC